MNTAIANVSSGEPSGRWKLWARWLALFAIIFSLALSSGATAIGRHYPYLFLGAMVFMFVRHRLGEQRLDLVIDQHPVQVTLYLDVLCRVWIEWSSQGDGGRACIGKSVRGPTWLDYEIELGRQRYKLRIYAKMYPYGYMVSNVGRGFEMAVIDNRFVFSL